MTTSRSEVEHIAERLIARGERLATAESCTGGLIAKLCTDLAGSSAWFDRGLVTYSNAAKHELLGVPNAVFDTDGAVSEACARAMVEGLLRNSPVHWSVAVTGIAGPGGGVADKPVGTVWIAWARRGEPGQAQHRLLVGDREAIREQTAAIALSGLLVRLRHAA